MNLPKSIKILGVPISEIDMDLAISTISNWIKLPDKRIICVRDVHGIILCQKDSLFMEIHNKADMVFADGMPIYWSAKLFGSKNIKRVTGPDFMTRMLDVSQSDEIKHFFYGSTEEVLSKLKNELTNKYPLTNIVGYYSPPFHILSEEEEFDIVNIINSKNPDILWVGLGSPKQEKWMYHIIKRLNTKILIGVGAAFDFHAGSKKRAPKWMQSIGLEWLFRLLSEPKRLWSRYLKHNPRFIWYFLLQLLGKKYD